MNHKNETHDIISTKKGLWVCKCGAHGKDRPSQEQHNREIMTIAQMVRPQPAFEETCM
jgi:hypothetical protein